MTHLIRTPEDPMGFTAPITCETGEVWLNVVEQRQDAWHTTVSTHFRTWKAPKANLSYERQFYVRTPEHHPNEPLSKITCIAQHAGANDPNLAVVHLKALIDDVQENAHKENIVLYEADSPDLRPYWHTAFDLEVIGDVHQSFTAGKPAYQPGESIPEPLAVAIQHELIKGDYGFQLTADPNAPTVEFVKIVKDNHYNWYSLELAAEHAKKNPAPAGHLELVVSTNHGTDRHRLFPRCIPLDNEWAALTTKYCPPEQVQRLLIKANTTQAHFEQYPKDTPHSEYVEDVMSNATWQAYNALYPNAGPLARFMSKVIRDAQQQDMKAPQEPVTVVSPDGKITLIAHRTDQPQTPVPTKLLAELEEALGHSNPHPNQFSRVAPVVRRLVDLKPKWYRTPATKDEDV